MGLIAHEVCSTADAKKFVDVQFMLYKNSEQWVPSLKSSEVAFIYPGEAWKASCDAKFWIVYKDGKAVGTIGAIVNKPYLEKTGEKIGRFTRFECIDDQQVANFLFTTAEDWLKVQGMQKVQGPLGFSNLDNQGMLVEGFDYLPSIASVYHKPYYKNLVERFGYEKENDWIEFRLTIGSTAVEKANRGSKIIQQRQGIEVVHFRTVKEILNYSDALFEILDDSFTNIPYTVPITSKLRDLYKKKYLGFLNPEFVKMVKIDGTLVGFSVWMPNMSKAMQKAKGSLFPFGFYYLMQARRGGTDTVDSLLGGVSPKYQSTGAIVVLFAELQKVMMKYNMKYIETTGIYEGNHSALSNWKNYDHIQHKKRRCFVKKLT